MLPPQPSIHKPASPKRSFYQSLLMPLTEVSQGPPKMPQGFFPRKLSPNFRGSQLGPPFPPGNSGRKPGPKKGPPPKRRWNSKEPKKVPQKVRRIFQRRFLGKPIRNPLFGQESNPGPGTPPLGNLERNLTLFTPLPGNGNPNERKEGNSGNFWGKALIPNRG